jgi:hypothetical protein
MSAWVEFIGESAMQSVVSSQSVVFLLVRVDLHRAFFNFELLIFDFSVSLSTRSILHMPAVSS